jgi:single-strand DNA-binding protein
MAATNINRVVMTGNLTADPELRSLPSGMSVCSLRIACNTRRKDGASGEWVDKPNYFNVTVWGAQGENAAKYLSKGRPVAIDGRLEWREWESQDGTKRQATDIIADSVQFLGSRDEASGGGPIEDRPAAGIGAQGGNIPVDQRDFQPAPVAAGAGDDDIPF